MSARRLFYSLVLCGFVFGFFLFRLLSLGGAKRTAPDALLPPSAPRHRPSRVCSSRVLVLVNSSPGSRDRRQAIRSTWAGPQVLSPLGIRVAFGVGSSSQPDIQRALDWEAEAYGDVFQDPVVEREGPEIMKPSFKVVALLRTARSACDPTPMFLLKIDDDVFVNPFALDRTLAELEPFSPSNTLWCLDWRSIFDSRRSNATWYVLGVDASSLDSHRPDHCSGKAYLMTSRALDGIVQYSSVLEDSAMLPEDEFVTRRVAGKARTAKLLLGQRLPLSDEELGVGKTALAYCFGDGVVEDTEMIWSLLEFERRTLPPSYDDPSSFY